MWDSTSVEMRGILTKKVLAAAKLGEDLGDQEVGRWREYGAPKWSEILRRVPIVVPELSGYYTKQHLFHVAECQDYLAEANSCLTELPIEALSGYFRHAEGEANTKSVVFTTQIAAAMHHDRYSRPSAVERSFINLIPKRLEIYDLSLSSGRFSSMASVFCLRDRVRTTTFLCGVREAVEQLGRDGDGEIRVVDAGCGAFPVLGIYAALCSPRCKVECVESNSVSAFLAAKVVEQLGLSERIEVVCWDANKFKPKGAVDLLVSETMDSGLRIEPLVSIMSHLVTFVRDGGVVLPSKVTVKAGVIPAREVDNPSKWATVGDKLSPLYDLHNSRSLDYTPGQQLDRIELTIPLEGLEPGSYSVGVTSDVRVGSNIINANRSVISLVNIATLDISLDQRYFGVSDRYFELSADTTKARISYAPGGSLDGAVSVE
jgi:hypothetical protein